MFTDTIRYVLGVLRGTGIDATDDPKNLHGAGVWVTPATMTWDRLDDQTGTVTLDLNLIGPPGDSRSTLAVLDRMAGKVHAATQARDFEAVTYTLTQGTLAGLRAQITLEVV